MIADEVQCGAMRTGDWWNIESKGNSTRYDDFWKRNRQRISTCWSNCFI